MTSKSAPDVARAMGVKELSTDQLRPNPHNPRLLFDKSPMTTLQESIGRVGILVPLTVYRRSSDGRYIILDGQRRWMCAQKLGLSHVPVNEVSEPSLVQNIVTMFQIHKLREDWELMPTALKLEVLIKELKEKSDRKLSELTGLDVAVVSRCRKLLSFSRSFQDRMLDPDPSHRIRADFFIELHPILHDRVVNEISEYSPGELTRRMLQKYQEPNGGIKAVTDFRRVKQHLANARRANQVKKLRVPFRQFVEKVELTPDHLLIPSADVSAQARTLLNKVEKVREALSELEVESYVGEAELWSSLEALLVLIRKCLADAGRRVK